MFSKTCEYAIRAAVYIAKQALEEKRVSLVDIAKQIGSPEAFTAKILQDLVRHNIVNSMKGPSGGFGIDNSRLSKIKLSHIVQAIDGDSIYKGCGLGLPECSEKEPCPVHEKFKVIRSELRMMLEKTSLFELASGLEKGLTVLKR
ncbi:MAG: Rrf2 family transcriptional regulator [Bacteroidia bacterium]|nr:Rrf2 family transcriptional regulator [Bacteroidia bacterium]